MALLHCYNKGCASKFDPANNPADGCKFHPGVPVFHDAMKGWSCCKKRSTDFTEFLNTPGCTTGPHSNEKPAEPEKITPVVDIPDTQQEEKEKEGKPQMMKQKIEVGEVERPPVDEPITRLPVSVAPSLEKAFEKALQQMTLQAADTTNTGNGETEVKVGTQCKNTGCQAIYKAPESNSEKCEYHPGTAIFHEGMKYWSCCQRKTSDFTNFLAQEGCASGKHLWIKPETEDTKKNCRMDWFQTGPNINISVFSKLPAPDQTYVEVNRITCHIHITFEGGKSIFNQTLILRNAIIPGQSSVKLLGTKVEIMLRKAEAFSWPSLEYKEPSS
ncbi:cysteine and histidine-rich domain-containing protein 1-like isoform X1 [Mya arenaria]|uniref:cysteine and histidine-rich domain-containing protein 1-like isoform X1 n=1 Tax=Mya arenaria TaxID=6604 RepID=UPI0022E3EA4D|nr:cysteine and histidine-rich domain-containing protein 1-like isoform X1 [Mya arenaria]